MVWSAVLFCGRLLASKQAQPSLCCMAACCEPLHTSRHAEPESLPSINYGMQLQTRLSRLKLLPYPIQCMQVGGLHTGRAPSEEAAVSWEGLHRPVEADHQDAGLSHRAGPLLHQQQQGAAVHSGAASCTCELRHNTWHEVACATATRKATFAHCLLNYLHCQHSRAWNPSSSWQRVMSCSKQGSGRAVSYACMAAGMPMSPSSTIVNLLTHPMRERCVQHAIQLCHHAACAVQSDISCPSLSCSVCSSNRSSQTPTPTRSTYWRACCSLTRASASQWRRPCSTLTSRSCTTPAQSLLHRVSGGMLCA